MGASSSSHAPLNALYTERKAAVEQWLAQLAQAKALAGQLLARARVPLDALAASQSALKARFADEKRRLAAAADAHYAALERKVADKAAAAAAPFEDAAAALEARTNDVAATIAMLTSRLDAYSPSRLIEEFKLLEASAMHALAAAAREVSIPDVELADLELLSSFSYDPLFLATDTELAAIASAGASDAARAARASRRSALATALNPCARHDIAPDDAAPSPPPSPTPAASASAPPSPTSPSATQPLLSAFSPDKVADERDAIINQLLTSFQALVDRGNDVSALLGIPPPASSGPAHAPRLPRAEPLVSPLSASARDTDWEWDLLGDDELESHPLPPSHPTANAADATADLSLASASTALNSSAARLIHPPPGSDSRLFASFLLPDPDDDELQSAARNVRSVPASAPVPPNHFRSSHRASTRPPRPQRPAAPARSPVRAPEPEPEVEPKPEPSDWPSMMFGAQSSLFAASASSLASSGLW
ncbi:uncharacterized protein AMSG_02242 [Thecamonas trahens ATCC 50062]|uniref:Uncharacterized protein n=1 Tax=Thecamonas trahens ATCC 50062 TaxID=461836 RepID=A0A0L0DXL0_THETB|nr:hypothetical protein AMSG_02242 [Thecamonas trahens ATCC 50062]KNC56273.1 hypothetical protein AMSG_02242 [Thecamonas trahens ATCC 50062]|eukprot:XP_013760792.1 hypothetical protein AMSG_02242 [Thecamonas trahens ATCC 50062]